MTGEERPCENREASSGEIRRVVEERSSFSGKFGLCNEDIDIADGRRPDIDEPDRRGDCAGSVEDSGELSAFAVSRSIAGRGIRVVVGELEAERVRPAIVWAFTALAASASAMRRSSRTRSRCRTEIARS